MNHTFSRIDKFFPLFRIRVAFGAVGLCVDLCFLRYAEGLEVRSLRQC